MSLGELSYSSPSDAAVAFVPPLDHNVEYLSYMAKRDPRLKAHLDTTGRTSWKTTTGDSETIWPPELEALMIEGLVKFHREREALALEIGYPKGGPFYKRNVAASDHLLAVSGVKRTSRQVASRIHDLRESCQNPELLALLNHGKIPVGLRYTQDNSIETCRTAAPFQDSVVAPRIQVVADIHCSSTDTPMIWLMGLHSPLLTTLSLSRPLQRPLIDESNIVDVCLLFSNSVQISCMTQLKQETRFVIYNDDIEIWREVGSMMPVLQHTATLNISVYELRIANEFWMSKHVCKDFDRITVVQRVFPRHCHPVSSIGASEVIDVVYYFGRCNRSPYPRISSLAYSITQVIPGNVLRTKYQSSSTDSRAAIPMADREATSDGWSTPPNLTTASNCHRSPDPERRVTATRPDVNVLTSTPPGTLRTHSGDVESYHERPVLGLCVTVPKPFATPLMVEHKMPSDVQSTPRTSSIALYYPLPDSASTALSDDTPSKSIPFVIPHGYFGNVESHHKKSVIDLCVVAPEPLESVGYNCLITHENPSAMTRPGLDTYSSEPPVASIHFNEVYGYSNIDSSLGDPCSSNPHEGGGYTSAVLSLDDSYSSQRNEDGVRSMTFHQSYVIGIQSTPDCPGPITTVSSVHHPSSYPFLSPPNSCEYVQFPYNPGGVSETESGSRQSTSFYHDPLHGTEDVDGADSHLSVWSPVEHSKYAPLSLPTGAVCLGPCCEA